MLNGRPIAARLPLVLILPLVLAGCISVTQRSPAPGSGTPGGSPSAAASAAVPTPTPRPTPEPTLPPVNAEVIGFLPNWLVADAAQALDTELLTTIVFHGVEAAGNGRLVDDKPSGEVPDGWRALDSPDFLSLKQRAQAAGVDVVVSIQRFGWSEGTLERTRTLLESRRNRRTLAERVAAFVEERGFDGASLDVEPVPEALADEYVALVREVRAELDAVDPELHLSVDVLPSLSGYDVAGLTGEGAADLAIIMGYNYRGDGSTVAGSTAPLRDAGDADLVRTVEAALALVPGERLVLALPWFGSAWPTESDEAGSATVNGREIDGPASPSYAESVPLATEWGRRFDPQQASAWTAYPDQQCPDCQAVWRQLWYDDADAFGAKVDHALQKGLAGVGMWALGQEAGREELWQALRWRLRPSADDDPPTGSASLDPETTVGEIDGVDVIEGSATLLLFPNDGAEGSGLALARVGLDGAVDDEGQLVTGITYPAEERITVPLGAEALGGAAESGPRTIFVQWRDIAGNWSPPLSIEAWVDDPATLLTPEDL